MDAKTAPPEQRPYGSPLRVIRPRRSRLLYKLKNRLSILPVVTMQRKVNPARKIIKEADEEYKDVLIFLETGIVSLLKNKNYQVSASTGLR